MDRLPAVRELWRQNCDQLEQWQQEELWKVLSDFTDIFALTDSEVGLTHLVQHEIDTGDARPIQTRPRRLPMAHREAADRAVEEMQSRDGVEKEEHQDEILRGLQTAEQCDKEGLVSITQDR